MSPVRALQFIVLLIIPNIAFCDSPPFPTGYKKNTNKKNAHNILVITNSHYLRHATRLVSKLKDKSSSNINLLQASHEEKNCSVENKKYDLIVSLGRRGLRHALCYYNKAPIYSALISQSHYQSSLQEYSATEDFGTRKITAFYIDQPLDKHLRFVKAVGTYVDGPVRVATILGKNTIKRKHELEALADKLNLKLEIAFASEPEDPAELLKSLSERNNLVIAIPDTHVFDRVNARGMLMIALARGIPVIGFTHASIDAGALGALYTPRYKQVKEISSNVLKIIEKKQIKLPRPHHPRSYSVAVNSIVQKRVLPKLKNNDELHALVKKLIGEH